MFFRSPVQIRHLYSRAAGYFLPQSMAADRSAANQARMFLVSHFIGPPLSEALVVVFYFLDPTPGFDLVVLALGIANFLWFPWLMKWGFRHRRLIPLSLLNLNFVIYWNCFHYGGIHSPTLIWVIILPILSVFYMGDDDRQKKELVALSAGSSVVFLAAIFWFSPEPNDVPDTAITILGACSLVGVMCYVAVMAIYYAGIFDAGVDLEREVARRRLMSIELRRSVETTDRAASLKSEFLAKMSHELRSPLNAIIGYGELLREDCEELGDDVMQKDLDKILEAGAYLTRLIDNILDLAKIDAGKMSFNPQPHDLCDVVDGILRSQEDLLARNRNAVSVSIEPDVRLVNVDGGRLVQIIESVVKNAATHTRDGRITIEAWPAEIRRQPAFEIVVRDTGCGIPPEHLSVIFETFLIDRDASVGRYGGTGLALSVTAKLCEAMGGSVSAVSTVGAGSTFTVTLPLAPVAAAVQQPSIDLADVA